MATILTNRVQTNEFNALNSNGSSRETPLINGPQNLPPQEEERSTQSPYASAIRYFYEVDKLDHDGQTVGRFLEEYPDVLYATAPEAIIFQELFRGISGEIDAGGSFSRLEHSTSEVLEFIQNRLLESEEQLQLFNSLLRVEIDGMEHPLFTDTLEPIHFDRSNLKSMSRASVKRAIRSEAYRRELMDSVNSRLDDAHQLPLSAIHILRTLVDLENKKTNARIAAYKDRLNLIPRPGKSDPIGNVNQQIVRKKIITHTLTDFAESIIYRGSTQDLDQKVKPAIDHLEQRIGESAEVNQIGLKLPPYVRRLLLPRQLDQYIEANFDGFIPYLYLNGENSPMRVHFTEGYLVVSVRRNDRFYPVYTFETGADLSADEVLATFSNNHDRQAATIELHGNIEGRNYESIYDEDTIGNLRDFAYQLRDHNTLDPKREERVGRFTRTSNEPGKVETYRSIPEVEDCTEDRMFKSIDRYWLKFWQLRKLEGLRLYKGTYDIFHQLHAAREAFWPMGEFTKPEMRKKRSDMIDRIIGNTDEREDPINSAELMARMRREYEINEQWVPFTRTINFDERGVYINTHNSAFQIINRTKLPQEITNETGGILIPWDQIDQEGYVGESGIRFRFTDRNDRHLGQLVMSLGGKPFFLARPDDPEMYDEGREYFESNVKTGFEKLEQLTRKLDREAVN